MMAFFFFYYSMYYCRQLYVNLCKIFFFIHEYVFLAGPHADFQMHSKELFFKDFLCALCNNVLYLIK